MHRCAYPNDLGVLCQSFKRVEVMSTLNKDVCQTHDGVYDDESVYPIIASIRTALRRNS